MRKIILALVALTALAVPASALTQYSPAERIDRAFLQLAQATVPSKPNVTTSTVTDTQTPVAPVSVTTVVQGGTVAAQIIDWLKVAFGSAISLLATGLIYKALSWMGVQVTEQQKSALQAVIVNGVNDAAAKAEVSLRNNPNLDVNVKSDIVAQAVRYTQAHAADTIKALGLDPQSGQAVEAIKARIATALNDPNTPTPPVITPKSAGGVA